MGTESGGARRPGPGLPRGPAAPVRLSRERERPIAASEPHVRLESRPDGPVFEFAGLRGEAAAHRHEEVRPALDRVEEAVAAGLHAAGFVTYEAAPGLDPSLTTRPAGALPLLWFGLFAERREGVPTTAGPHPHRPPAWAPDVEAADYGAAVEAIRRLIAAGHTYQVNYTYRLRAPFGGDPRDLYRALATAQSARYCALVDRGDHCLASASPELFFSLEGGRLVTRPMKGTRPRGRWAEEDEDLARQLLASPKERAENVMIVDLLRNDLGRVARRGSVRVPELWQVERYETVWQLTSTVEAQVDEGVGLADLFAALFPCGSVTGAPKVRTMQIIRDLEASPRGVYTGCIGFLSPAAAGEARLNRLSGRFSVAIRTAHVDRVCGRAEYGVGGGITWDSDPAQELAECRTKARILGPGWPSFSLLETLLFEPGEGYYLLGRHLARLASSARYFGFTYDASQVRRALDAAVEALPDRAVGDGPGAWRVRLTLERDGGAAVRVAALAGGGRRPWRAAVAAEPVESSDPFLFHKTTHRRVYAERRARHPECDEVILQNEEGALTECTVGNLVVVLGGRALTPPVACGLLPGTFRAEALDRGEVEEAGLRPEDLAAAEAVYMINSVRRRVPLDLAPPVPAQGVADPT